MSVDKVKRPAEFIINVSLSSSNDLQGHLSSCPAEDVQVQQRYGHDETDAGQDG